MRRTLASLVTAAAAVTLAGCNNDLTNPNNPTLGGALTNPRAATSRMIVGVLASHRDQRLLLRMMLSTLSRHFSGWRGGCRGAETGEELRLVDAGKDRQRFRQRYAIGEPAPSQAAVGLRCLADSDLRENSRCHARH